jgi:DNA repair protein RadD
VTLFTQAQSQRLPMTLRPYQTQAVDAVYEHLRMRDDNPCVVIPTGGGKTPVIARICSDAVTRWNGRVLILAHVKELLEQAKDKLDQVCPDIHVGIYSAGLKRRDTSHPVIIAGIQSVYQKADQLGHFDLVIVDEAHMIPIVDGDGMYRRLLTDMRQINPALRVIGLARSACHRPMGFSTASVLRLVCAS